MMGLLAEYGYTLVDKLEDADAVLLNSCTVKNPSQDTFLFMVEKAKEMGKHIVVSGWVPQGDRNIKGLEDVSILGVTQIDRVVEVMEETIKGNVVKLLTKKELPTLDLPKIRKNKLLEIIPISTGWLNSCTYCKTKHARGKLGSYAPEAIINRAKQAIEEGIKEIWITSEDTGAYGRDIGSSLPELLRGLISVAPGHVMIRVGMTNPPYILEHLDAMADILNHPRMFSFLHIPVQSGSNPVLLNMNREYTVEEFKKVWDHLLERVPNLSLATDIICGFPFETTEQFDETLELVDHYKFPVVNISKFYSRPGTEAAKWKKVPLKEVKERSTKLTHLFNEYRCYDHYQDTIQRVWIFENDDKSDETVVGHTKGYVKVLIKKEQGVDLLGQQVIIKVTSTHKWHVCGDIIDYHPDPIPIEEDYFEKWLLKRQQKVTEIQVSEEQKVDQTQQQKVSTNIEVNEEVKNSTAESDDIEVDNIQQPAKLEENIKEAKIEQNGGFKLHRLLGAGLIAVGAFIIYKKVTQKA